MDEKNIISGCKAKNAVAQKAFVDMYAKYLYGICLRYAGDSEYAKDCLQESLIQILNNIDKYTERGKFKSWCARVTVIKCLNILRKDKKKLAEGALHDMEFGVAENVHLKMEQDEVLAFIKQLPVNYRIALNMYLVEGYAHKEIADHLNISLGSSRSLVSRGRQMIKSAFSNDHMHVIYKQEKENNSEVKKLNSL